MQKRREYTCCKEIGALNAAPIRESVGVLCGKYGAVEIINIYEIKLIF
jgi:hypothetical protein